MIRYLRRYSNSTEYLDLERIASVHRFKETIEEFLNEKLYGKEDFCLSEDPLFDQKIPVHVKLGRLYVWYMTGQYGKGTFAFEVYSIDNNKRQKKLLFDFKKPCSVNFHKLIPFTLIDVMSIIFHRYPENINQACLSIRNLLMQLAENKEINGNEFKNAVRVFVKAKNTLSSTTKAMVALNNATQVAAAPNYATKEKIKHVAEEIAQIYYNELGITLDDIIKVMVNNGFNKSCPLTQQFFDDVFISHIDQDIYQLMMLIPAKVQSAKSKEAIIDTVNANFKLESTTFLACADRGEKNENQIQNDRG